MARQHPAIFDYSNQICIAPNLNLFHYYVFTKGIFKTKIEKGTPFKRSITKSIEQTSKFTEANAESRTKNTSCMQWRIQKILVGGDLKPKPQKFGCLHQN